MPPLYDPEQVQPMWEELAQVGVRPLTTAQDVDAVLGKREGTVLCVVNSVCGCAAGSARPGVTLSLQHEKIPDELVTVFAGMDQEAVARARDHMSQVPPSSPCIAVFKDGLPVHVLERRHIERMNAVEIANNLAQVYDQICTRQGPSVSREEYESHTPHKACGSSIAPYSG